MGPFMMIVASLAFYVFPICLVLFNRRFSRTAKFVGVLATLFFSWFGFIGFFVLMAIQKRADA